MYGYPRQLDKLTIDCRHTGFADYGQGAERFVADPGNREPNYCAHNMSLSACRAFKLARLPKKIEANMNLLSLISRGLVQQPMVGWYTVMGGRRRPSVCPRRPETGS